MRKLVYLPLIFAFCVSIHAQNQRGPSTPVERQRFVALVHKMEQAPLDESLRPEIAWGLKWLVEIPDISVSVCTAPFGKFWDEKYKGVPDHFVAQFTFAMAAYIIEHSDSSTEKPASTGASKGAVDNITLYIAGMESVLRAYQSVLKTNPKAHSKNLDDLLQKQSEGKLGDFIRNASQKCNKTN